MISPSKELVERHTDAELIEYLCVLSSALVRAYNTEDREGKRAEMVLMARGKADEINNLLVAMKNRNIELGAVQ